MDQKKQNKKRKSVTLKPINDAWLGRRAFEESTPENRVSESEIVDRLIDEARLKEAAESQSPSEKKTKHALSARPVAIAMM